MKRISTELSKDEQISRATKLLKDQNVSVGRSLIKPPYLCGIGTWGIIDFLVNNHGYKVVAWDSPLDV